MTQNQERLFKLIQAEKAKASPDRGRLRVLTAALVSEDDVSGIRPVDEAPMRPHRRRLLPRGCNKVVVPVPPRTCFPLDG